MTRRLTFVVLLAVLWPAPASAKVRPSEAKFASALADGIARDVKARTPRETIARVVVRWFEPADPGYFTVHVLTAKQRRAVDDDVAWYPLEWAGSERELARTDRLARRPAVKAAAKRLAASYAERPPEGDELEASPAIVETVRRLRGALRRAGLRLDTTFAASAAHFEGWGARAVLNATASKRTRDALRRRGEFPAD